MMGAAEQLDPPSEEQLEQEYPQIPWREPIPVQKDGIRVLACRYCIAMRGLKGTSIEELPRGHGAFYVHLIEHHQRLPAQFDAVIVPQGDLRKVQKSHTNKKLANGRIR